MDKMTEDEGKSGGRYDVFRDLALANVSVTVYFCLLPFVEVIRGGGKKDASSRLIVVGLPVLLIQMSFVYVLLSINDRPIPRKAMIVAISIVCLLLNLFAIVVGGFSPG